MQLLETKFITKGFEYEQIARTNNVAIYAQKYSGQKYVKDGTVAAYEVFEIIRSKSAKVRRFDKQTGEYVEYVTSDKESYPKDEYFGVTAWSFMAMDKERALLFFSELDKEVIERNKNKTLKENEINKRAEEGAVD